TSRRLALRTPAIAMPSLTPGTGCKVLGSGAFKLTGMASPVAKAKRFAPSSRGRPPGRPKGRPTPLGGRSEATGGPTSSQSAVAMLVLLPAAARARLVGADLRHFRDHDIGLLRDAAVFVRVRVGHFADAVRA